MCVVTQVEGRSEPITSPPPDGFKWQWVGELRLPTHTTGRPGPTTVFPLPLAVESDSCFSGPGDAGRLIDRHWRLRGLHFPKCRSYPISPMALNHSEMLTQQTQGCLANSRPQVSGERKKKLKCSHRTEENDLPFQKHSQGRQNTGSPALRPQPQVKYSCHGTLEVTGPEQRPSHFTYSLNQRNECSTCLS